VKTDVDQRFRKEETKERERKAKRKKKKKREDVVLCHREKEKKI
jgi:hypothetical protein